MRYSSLMRAMLTVLLLMALPVLGAQAADIPAKVYAASDGAGNVRIAWFVSPEHWPAGGWRLEDDQGNVLLSQIQPGDEEAMKPLSEQDQAAILRWKSREGHADPATRKNVALLFMMHAVSDWEYARAAGLGRELRWLPAGPRRFRVVALTAEGQVTKTVLTTGHIDPRVATPLPPAPTGLQAISSEDGIALYWQPPAGKLPIPAFSYAVRRGTAGFGDEIISLESRYYGKQWDVTRPAFLDWRPPVEEDVTYQVQALDVLGRGGESVRATLFVQDFDALRPPKGLKASAEAGRVELEWQASENPHTAGVVLARAYLHEGPYEVLHAGVLSATSTRYQDKDVLGGTNYYYRLQAVNARGELGAPSVSAAAQPRALKPPAVPQGLSAEVGPTRVRLTWEPVEAAGYILERRAPGVRKWSRLNERLLVEPRHDDHLGAGNGGEIEYRVSAVGQDNQESDAGKPLRVALPDTVSPGAPAIIAAEGGEGRVMLRFVSAAPEEGARQFLVLRAGSADEPGLVLGDPLPGKARSFEDPWVEAGQRYWYRLVALDAAGNRSEPGEAVAVRVVHPAIPAPPKPSAEFIDKPLAQVRLDFRAPPEGLSVIVQGAVDDAHWRHVSGPTTGSSAIDTSPPRAGAARYRIIYQATSGAMGPPSEVVTVSRP